MTTLTAPTALKTARSRPALAAFQPDDTRRGRLNAAAFGVLVFFGLTFPMAVVLPGAMLLAGEAAALVLAVFAAGRLMGARDRHAWISAGWWVTAAIVGTAVVLAATFAFLALGPLAP